MYIQDEFNDISQSYDSQRRLLIPYYDEFYGLPLEAVSCEKDEPNVLDLGCGTGLFASMVIQRYPKASITLIDVAGDMLEVAKRRFSGNEKITYIVGDYTEHSLDGSYDIIISALSIHHLTSRAKKALYHRCYELLHPGGTLVNADQFKSPSSRLEDLNLQELKAFHRTGTLSEEDITQAYERMKHDKTDTLYEQLSWLMEAGFSEVDCLYKCRQFGAVYAKK